MSTTIRRFIFVPTFLVTLLLVSATVVMAEKAEKLAFTATSTGCDPGNLAPGTVFINKKGTILHIRGMEHCGDVDASDDRMDGRMINVLNANLRVSFDPVTFILTGSGPGWGTFRIDNGTAGWEGTYSGDMYVWKWNMFTNMLEEANTMTKAVGHGTGDYEGLKLEMTTVQDSPPEFVAYGLGVITNTNPD